MIITNNKYFNKIHSKGLSDRKKKLIAQDFIEGINSNPLGSLLLNLAIINELKTRQKKVDIYGKKEND